jgi:pimeloyl-ACP methyl ester carboxylesterase
MTYAPVNGLRLYYEIHGSGRPLVLLHGGLLTIDLNFGALLEPLAVNRQVIAVETQGHGHTADTARPMTIEALAGDVVALLDHLGIDEADFFGFSLGGLVAYGIALGAPAPWDGSDVRGQAEPPARYKFAICGAGAPQIANTWKVFR